MAEKFKEQAVVLTQEQIAGQIFSMWLQTEQIAAAAVPGQFISVYSNDSGRMLPRPISICETDPKRNALRIVYRVAGKGTEEFSRCVPGDRLDILGPLGNGFPLERCAEGKTAFLIGGGIGIPPMVQLAKELNAQRDKNEPGWQAGAENAAKQPGGACAQAAGNAAAGKPDGRIQVVVGYRDELFLTEDLQKNGALYVATEDGSAGTKGNVLDCIRENGLTANVIYACGPTPMLRAVKAYAQEHGIECWISMEERMACGIGACLACVCKSKEIDGHSKVHNKRICKEGPVFLADEVEL